MLHLISDAPVVSSGTLRPDHLCQALLSEADRLGIDLPRDLSQPARAIVAHGTYGGICLDLPPWLDALSGEIIGELFDTLNDAAPSGCYLGCAYGDGACFLWHVDMEAQAEAINTDPKSRFEAKVLDVPEHWLSAIVNGNESSFIYYDDPADYTAYQAFCSDELSYGWDVSSYAEESEFMHYHDARAYGVLPCSIVRCLAMRARK